jgi:hypothetical protein
LAVTQRWTKAVHQFQRTRDYWFEDQKSQIEFFSRPVSQPGHRCGKRHHPNGQHRSARQAVKERTLAGLESAEHGHINTVASVKLPPASGYLGLKIGQLQFPGQAGNAVKNAVDCHHSTNANLRWLTLAPESRVAVPLHPRLASVACQPRPLAVDYPVII